MLCVCASLTLTGNSRAFKSGGDTKKQSVKGATSRKLSEIKVALAGGSGCRSTVVLFFFLGNIVNSRTYQLVNFLRLRGKGFFVENVDKKRSFL
jgi:hypothetical protein